MLDDGDVSTVGPDLGRGLAVHPPAQHVLARSNVAGDEDRVEDGDSSVVRGLVAGAEAGSVPFLAGRREARVRSVVTRGAVTAESSRTGNTRRPRLAASTQTPRRDRVHGPG